MSKNKKTKIKGANTKISPNCQGLNLKTCCYTKASLPRVSFLRYFLVQDIAGRFTRPSIFLDKILAATILRVILRRISRKFLAEPFTRDAHSNVAAIPSNIAKRLFAQATTVLVSHLAMAKIRKRQAAAAIMILNHCKKKKKRR